MIPLPLTDPADIPSLERVFGQHTQLMKAFERARITSVPPVMCLPRQALMEFHGIGERTATYITGALAQVGRGHHIFSERLSEFIDREFGCIEDAPISVLSITLNEDGARPCYVPLQFLRLLEEVTPPLKVLTVLESSAGDLLEMIEERVMFGPTLYRLKDDLEEIDRRLSRWDPTLHIGALKGTRRRHLSLVNSQ